MKNASPEVRRLEAKVAELRARVQSLEEQESRWLELPRVLRRLLLLTVKRPLQAFAGKLGPLRRNLTRTRIRASQAGAFRPYQVQQRTDDVQVVQKPERILHLIGNFITGGSSQLVIDLIERLGTGYEQRVVTRHLPHPPAYTGLYIEEETLLTSGGTRRLSACIEQWKPSIVHVHYWGTYDWEWYHRVFQILGNAKHRAKIIENINVPIAPYIHSAVDAYVYVSGYVRREFGVPGGKNYTIYPGSNFELFSSLASTPNYQQDSQTPCIGMVYRLTEDKINHASIDVFISAVRKLPGLRAVIVGGGPLLVPYRQAVAAAGLEDSFEFTGYVSYENLPSIYQRFSVFVAPVHTESFGQVAPFAMNMRIPVAGYRVGALPEIVNDDSLLVAPADSNALSDIIVGLMQDPKRRVDIGAVNYQRAQELFSVESMITRYDGIYRSLLEDAARVYKH